jgi:ADP-ribose pyrophosphatase
MQDWEKLGEEIIEQNQFITYLKRRYKMPDGSLRTYYLADYKDGAVVFALTKDKEVLLVREFRPGPEKWLLDLPAGAIDRGEDALEAGKRELLEETGYKVGKIISLGSLVEHSYLKGIDYLFLAWDCEKDENYQLEEESTVGLVKMSWAEFEEHLKKGQMIQLGAALLARDYLKEHKLI